MILTTSFPIPHKPQLDSQVIIFSNQQLIFTLSL